MSFVQLFEYVLSKMSKGEWKIDDKDEAVFIDCEEALPEGEDPNHLYSEWCNLPDLILEQVFSYLTERERYYASMACRNWRRGFHMPYVWHTFKLEDNTLTRRKFNYYYGWQHVLDHYRTQMCITRVGRHFRRLVFRPALNFFNLYEFMNMVSYYAERVDEEGVAVGVGPRVTALSYHFPCHMAAREDAESARTFGTGGKLLGSLKRLMGNLVSLRHLELTDLLLEPAEAHHLLDEVCATCCLALRTLSIINTTKLRCQILHAGVFLNLQVLSLSPQNLGADLLQLLGDSRLRHLHLVQNRYTPPDAAFATVPPRCWRACRTANPRLAVHLELRDVKHRTELVQQEGAPVRTLLYDTEYIKVHTESVMAAVDLYKADLRVFAHRGLPRFYQPRAFHERCDSVLLSLCRHCAALRTLMVRERVSTASVLLLARAGTNLRHLVVRRNAVVMRCDWPKAADWSDDFYAWLRVTAKSYSAVEREVSLMMGRPWAMLTDRQFKLAELNLHDLSD